MASLIPGLLDLMPDEVIVEPHVATDGAGQSFYAAGVIIPARVVEKQQRVRGSDGQERVSRAMAWLASGQVSVRDRFTLPVRFGESLQARQPDALAVGSFPDENGPHHQKVWF